MQRLTRPLRAAAAALLLAVLAPVAQAMVTCDAPDGAGVQRCSTGLEPAQVSAMQRTQEQGQWCWAASIAMVFAHHGYEVTQEEVVRRQFGQLVDRPLSGSAITRMLAHSWFDGGGRGFYTTTAVSDKTARRFQLGDASVVRELAQQRPLILGASGHSVVLVRVQFERSAGGQAVRIVGGTVIDPAPGRGVRALQAGEMDPSYLAAVQLAATQQMAGLSMPTAVH